jgi:electron transfer flavoprotein alpha/beta subunit
VPIRVVLMVRRLHGQPNGAVAAEVLREREQAALAAALTLRAESRAIVSAIALGPARREDRVLATALRAGCDRAIRVYDNQVSGLDYLGTAHILAATARHVGYDVLLCGERSEDERQGAIGAAVAEVLGIPHVTGAHDVRLDGESAVVTRRAGRRVQRLRLRWPGLITIARFGRRPSVVPEESADERALDRDPPHRAPLAAIEEVDLATLGLDARELTHRAQFLGFARPVRTLHQSTMLRSARDLVARLGADRLLE